LIKAVRQRIKELRIKHVVVASDSGETGIRFWKTLKDLKITLVSVTEHAGYGGGDAASLGQKKRGQMEAMGIKVLTCAHALSGLERSIADKFGGVGPTEIIAHTLRRFGSEGLKVAVEVAVMAADSGLVPTNREIIACGGSYPGADAAIVLQAAHMNNFFDIEIREIIAKPRQRKRPRK
jgi:hypothetical protein